MKTLSGRFAIRAICGIVAAAAWAVAVTDVRAADGRKPNVLFLLTDDQRADGVGALGQAMLKTPAMDSLARRGMVFRNNYCFGSNVGAVCCPSRNMLMSGRAYFRWEGQRFAPADQPNFPDVMHQAGYFTYHHGKKTNTAELIQAKFDVNKYIQNDLDREGGEPGLTIMNDAITFLRERKAKGEQKPFFMYLAPPNPHDPRIAAPKYMDLYPLDKMPLPANYLPVHPFDNGEMIVRDELLAPWPRTKEEIRKHLRDYYASITGLDYHFGRLLKVLDELKLTDSTIIVFASDNGLSIGSHGLMGKQNLYEEAAKVPLIIAGPGIPKGQTDAFVYLMDIFPTVCDLIGAPVPADLDGKSLKGVINGKAKIVRDKLLYCYRDVQRAIRDGRWKLIRYPKIDKTQLFDLQNDPEETRDLSGSTLQADRINQMMADLPALQKQYGDSLPLSVSIPQDPTFTPPTGEALEKLLSRVRHK